MSHQDSDASNPKPSLEEQVAQAREEVERGEWHFPWQVLNAIQKKRDQS